jgi:hypothetical protein
MPERPPSTQIALRLAKALEVAQVPYAIGGAIALGVWSIPRATYDVDLDLFVSAEELLPVLPILQRAGCLFETEQVMLHAAERGAFEVYCEGVRVDGFVHCLPLYDSAQARCRPGPLEGETVRYLSPEDLATFKMLFFRPKDLVDLERLLAIQGEHFDDSYVRGWLVDLVGEDDERTTSFDALVLRAKQTREPHKT